MCVIVCAFFFSFAAFLFSVDFFALDWMLNVAEHCDVTDFLSLSKHRIEASTD